MRELLSFQDLPFAVQGENPHGLSVLRKEFEPGGADNVFYQFDLPDGVVVFALTTNRKVIAIEKERPGVGKYPQLPGETCDMQEMLALRNAMLVKDVSAVEEVACAVASRCLITETGYTPGKMRLMTILQPVTGKTPMVHAFVLAEDCVQTSAQGSEQEEERITLLPLTDVVSAWEMLMKYISSDSAQAHGGKNSLVGMTLAFRQLGALTVGPIPEYLGIPTVLALRGLPLSGKTTLSQALLRELRKHGDPWVVLVVDDFRDAGAGKPDRDTTPNPFVDPIVKKREGEDMRIAYTLLHEAVKVNIGLGRNVIVNATYSNQRSQRFLLDIVNAHPNAILRGVRCVFNDTDEEIARRLSAADRLQGRGGCKSVEHYLTDKLERHDYTNLWGDGNLLEINTSQSLVENVAKVLAFVDL